VSVAPALLLPASDHAHDIPILNQAKAEYAKLQWQLPYSNRGIDEEVLCVENGR
jgi:hypothetical protein